MMKSGARALVASALHFSGVFAVHRRIQLRGGAVIVLYHRVLRPSEVRADLDPAIYVSTDTFERHLGFLSRTFEMVNLDALVAWRQGRRTFAKPPCVITFDDGWADNFTNAYPLLQRYGVPATIFLITGQVGKPDFVTWEQVREMERGGIRFGSHTVSHPVVVGLEAGELATQLSLSKHELAKQTTHPSCWFCYPKGYNDEPARQEARRHYCAAVTTRFAPTYPDDDLYAIPRVSVHDDVSRTPALLALRLAGWLRRSPTG
jgi:peptidoglycan/xylan/chitin deacetylase (PgdA/CDA1 family)